MINEKEINELKVKIFNNIELFDSLNLKGKELLNERQELCKKLTILRANK